MGGFERKKSVIFSFELLMFDFYQRYRAITGSFQERSWVLYAVKTGSRVL